MDKKAVLELKRRMKKDECTFRKMVGCYVDGNKNKVVKIDETFLNLEDEEYYKYLEIAKKALSGTIGNNLLELEFPREEEQPGGHQQFLMGLKASGMKNQELLDSFYDMVIEKYDYVGNYLILLFNDAYDVIVKTTDNNKIDESEEVYEYFICAICPVSLSKPGLGYRKDENRIGTMDRDWMVGAPETGFTFPAFTDRSTDIHSVMFYTKDAKKPHEEFIKDVLGCIKKRTATQKQIAFKEIVKENVDEGIWQDVNETIQDKISQVVEEQESTVLTGQDIAKIMMESGVPESSVKSIENKYVETFRDEMPEADQLVDAKVLKAYGAKIARLELEAEVNELKKQLEEAKGIDNNSETEVLVEAEQEETSKIVVNVDESKKEEIRAEIINGQKCIVIPVYEDEEVLIKSN